jgi:hypothetical protein
MEQQSAAQNRMAPAWQCWNNPKVGARQCEQTARDLFEKKIEDIFLNV